MTLNGIDIAKKAVGLVVGAGASKIVHAIIQNNISPEKVIDKITIVSASVVIGSMAREATKEYTDRQIDNAVAAYHALSAAVKAKTGTN
jgi:hypothetical protein